MDTRTPLFWFRIGTAALMVVLCASELVEHVLSNGGLHVALICALYLTYAGLFLKNTAGFPRRAAWQTWILLAQIAVSVPLESNLTVVTAATIPLVADRKHWRRWLILTLVLVALQLGNKYRIAITNPQNHLPPGTTALTIAVVIVTGIAEILGWHLFAFVAAILIVRFDEDRRRLAMLNAEMKGAQVLLLDSGRLAERLRISRELHDSLGHHLTSLTLQLEIAEHLPDDQLRPTLGQARFLSRLLLAEIRQAVSDWRSETSPALPEALQSLSEGLPGLTVELDMQPELPATAPTITHALFRCAQEGLTNAMRHGSAAKVQLSLNQEENNLKLRIADDGAGCANVAPGNGLKGMITRMAEVGGAVSFDTAPGKGFRLEIRVPVPEVALQ